MTRYGVRHRVPTPPQEDPVRCPTLAFEGKGSKQQHYVYTPMPQSHSHRRPHTHSTRTPRPTPLVPLTPTCTTSTVGDPPTHGPGAPPLIRRTHSPLCMMTFVSTISRSTVNWLPVVCFQEDTCDVTQPFRGAMPLLCGSGSVEHSQNAPLHTASLLKRLRFLR